VGSKAGELVALRQGVFALDESDFPETSKEVTVSIGDRDMIFRRGPGDIRNRQFVWVRKGYDPDQVQDFLAQVADMVDALQAELTRAQGEVERSSWQKTAARDEAYQELATRIADVLRTAEAHAEAVRRDAEQEGQQVLAKAQAEAEEARKSRLDEIEKIRREAVAEAETLRREAAAEAERIRRENAEAMKKARAEAEHIVSVLASRRDILLAEVNATRERLVGILEKVNAAMPAGAPEVPSEAPPIKVPEAETPEPAEPPRERRRERPISPPRGSSKAPAPEPLELVLPDIPALEEEPLEK
jgi:DivIVA domain-containing protein